MPQTTVGASVLPVLPDRCDVLVIGAGPAGSACAMTLSAGGLDVVLVDQHDFPRDKVCGDALIPDAHAALRRIGALDEVLALATPAQAVRCVAPRGATVDVPGTIAVLPRRVLDHLLVRKARHAGVRLLTPLRFAAPLLEGERVVGARLLRQGLAHELRARWVVLATGAGPQALIAAGLCERHTPSGIALRAYVQHDGLAPDFRHLQMTWHPRLRGGYGWIFPGPGGRFNIGAGLTGSHLKQRGGKGQMVDVNLRQMFEAFCDLDPTARELMRGGRIQGELKGAPLRCSLQGARISRPGLLATGEAVGSTYAFTGEGIGKAMETGLLAADALLRPDEDDAGVRARYAASLQTLKPKFDLYETASRFNMHPWLADVVVWRARRSERIRARLSGILEETQNPARLFSLRGVHRLLTE